MKNQATFACCRFSAASSRLALPVEHVTWVHDNDRDAPHICDILNIESEALEQRVIQLQSGDGAPLYLSVDLPIGVEDFDVEAVLPKSASQTDEYTEAIIRSEGEFVLLLDGKKLSQALRALDATSETEANK